MMRVDPATVVGFELGAQPVDPAVWLIELAAAGGNVMVHGNLRTGGITYPVFYREEDEWKGEIIARLSEQARDEKVSARIFAHAIEIAREIRAEKPEGCWQRGAVIVIDQSPPFRPAA